MANDNTSGTVTVNGQRFTTPMWSAFAPRGFGPQTTGVPMITPSMPPFVGASASSAPSMTEMVGGYGTAGNNAIATQIAGDNPWNWRASPVLWVVGGLLLSIWLLRTVHWRETLLEGAAEGRVGPVGGGAHAEAG